MSLGDITASLFTAIGVNAALYQRQITGLGQKIDVSMLDSQVAILENALVRYQAEGVSPQPLGTRHPTIAPFQAYRAKDRYFVIAVGNDALWKTFCLALQLPEMTGDPRFVTNVCAPKISAALNILAASSPPRRSDWWLSLILQAFHRSHQRYRCRDERFQVLSRYMIGSVERSWPELS
jgi:CoA:oxalate CoA-transferase